jgi:predicted nucleotidyltransferase
MTSDKEILERIKSTVKEQAPDAKIILYGSRARGDARSDSDWDILVLLDREKIKSPEHDRIAYPLYELGWDLGADISVFLYTMKDWEKRKFTIFHKNVEAEGIVL